MAKDGDGNLGWSRFVVTCFTGPGSSRRYFDEVQAGKSLACNAFALSPEQRNRHFDELGPALRALKKSVRELGDGYEFEFPADAATLQLLAEWTVQERMCCPFFDINLRLEREGGPLWLRLTGRKGTKEFIKVEAAAWISQ